MKEKTKLNNTLLEHSLYIDVYQRLKKFRKGEHRIFERVHQDDEREFEVSARTMVFIEEMDKCKNTTDIIRLFHCLADAFIEIDKYEIQKKKTKTGNTEIIKVGNMEILKK